MILFDANNQPKYQKTDKLLEYPTVLRNIYYISEQGRVFSVINNAYIPWYVRNNYPCVNLSCNRNGKVSIELFYVKDLVACNYIQNAYDYLERGYHAANIDGNTMNCYYQNIVYIK